MMWLLLAGALAAGPGTPSGGGSQGASAPAGPEVPREAEAEERKRLEEQIARELGTSAAPASSAAPAPSPPAPAGAATGGNPYARLLLLPDISAIGRGALAWNQLDAGLLSPRQGPVAPAGKLQPFFQELEMGLQAVVDPYLRADVFLTFGPEGAAAEEAYVTTLGLPGGLQVKAGTLYAPFGRQNQQHPHAWDFVDGPLSQSRQVAAEGLKGPGLDLAWLAPLPWFAELHLAYQETTPAFEPSGRRTGTVRLVQFFELAEGATLGAGLSVARLDEGGGAWRDLFGGDLTLRIRPPRGRAYLALQGELFARRLSGLPEPEAHGRRLGGYGQAFLRLSPFWGLGARWDTAPAEVAGFSGGPEQRASALLAWYPSEFSRLRLQLSYDRLPGGKEGMEALLSLEFSIGAHGAHPF